MGFLPSKEHMSLQAILFDLDGLLVDSEPAWYRARTELARSYNAVWTQEDQIAQAGVHTQVWVENVRKCLGNVLTASAVQEEIVSRMEAYYLAGEVDLMPGANEALQTCSLSYRVALASGSPIRLISAAITGAGWSSVFEEVISSDHVPRGKPAPDVYVEVLRRLGVPPKDSCVVEDSGAGIKAGISAGSIVVAVPAEATHPGEKVLAQADHVIPTLHDLALILESINT